LTGAPGSGKSSLARSLAGELGDDARTVPMDGFHFSHETLSKLGRLERMGAIDTFDVDGFVSLLRRLGGAVSRTVYAPEWDRDREQVVADATAIGPEARLLIVEGNYLLVPDGPWGELRQLLDEVWYCERDETARLADLIERHAHYGKSPERARAWALGPDQRNAELIARTRNRADLIVRISLAPEPTDEPAASPAT
jgi:pantothenate kinase